LQDQCGLLASRKRPSDRLAPDGRLPGTAAPTLGAVGFCMERNLQVGTPRRCCLSGTDRVVLMGEGVRLHLDHRLGEVVDLLERVADLLRVRADLVERPQQAARAVIGLRRGDGMEVAALDLELLIDLGVQRLGVQRLGVGAVIRRIGGDRHHPLDGVLAAELQRGILNIITGPQHISHSRRIVQSLAAYSFPLQAR
jgi:hypothetical protein